MENQTGKKRSNYGLIGLGIALIGLLIALVVFLLYRRKEKNQPAQTNNDYVIERNDKTHKLTKDEQQQTFAQIFNFIVDKGFTPEFARTLAGVSANESGRWSSNLAVTDNNIFGMKAGGAGSGIPIGSDSGFAVYDSYDSSINDVCEWFIAKGYPKEDETLTSENILQWMKSKKYFEAPLASYKTAVLSLINELQY